MLLFNLPYKTEKVNYTDRIGFIVSGTPLKSILCEKTASYLGVFKRNVANG